MGNCRKRNIIKKKFNSELIYSKKYLKTGKKIGFQCLFAQVILIDSVYRKDGNYYPKGLLEKSYVIEYIGIYCSNCEKEYYDEECIIFFF